MPILLENKLYYIIQAIRLPYAVLRLTYIFRISFQDPLLYILHWYMYNHLILINISNSLFPCATNSSIAFIRTHYLLQVRYGSSCVHMIEQHVANRQLIKTVFCLANPYRPTYQANIDSPLMCERWGVKVPTVFTTISTSPPPYGVITKAFLLMVHCFEV